jgi:hypothetical protein
MHPQASFPTPSRASPTHGHGYCVPPTRHGSAIVPPCGLPTGSSTSIQVERLLFNPIMTYNQPIGFISQNVNNLSTGQLGRQNARNSASSSRAPHRAPTSSSCKTTDTRKMSSPPSRLIFRTNMASTYGTKPPSSPTPRGS